jgi:hypothetical protein
VGPGSPRSHFNRDGDSSSFDKDARRSVISDDTIIQDAPISAHQHAACRNTLMFQCRIQRGS